VKRIFLLNKILEIVLKIEKNLKCMDRLLGKFKGNSKLL